MHELGEDAAREILYKAIKIVSQGLLCPIVNCTFVSLVWLDAATFDREHFHGEM